MKRSCSFADRQAICREKCVDNIKIGWTLKALARQSDSGSTRKVPYRWRKHRSACVLIYLCVCHVPEPTGCKHMAKGREGDSSSFWFSTAVFTKQYWRVAREPTQLQLRKRTSDAEVVHRFLLPRIVSGWRLIDDGSEDKHWHEATVTAAAK